MGWRGWLTVILTALAGPAGSAGLAVGLARWAEATTGGMASLAAAVAGLSLGAPLLALVVFGVCLFTLMGDAPIRRGIALLLMLVTVTIEVVVGLMGLAFVAGSANPELGLVVVGIVVLGVLGAGAYAALRLSYRRIPAVAPH